MAAISSEFDLGASRVTCVTPVMTHGHLGGRSCCQGAVQKVELVPKTEVGADL